MGFAITLFILQITKLQPPNPLVLVTLTPLTETKSALLIRHIRCFLSGD